MTHRETEGTIVRGYCGFYYVLAGEQTYTCSLRGKFRLKENNRVFLPGDRVRIRIREGDKGVIEDVYPRRTELLRPPIANVDQVLLVFALANPDPDFVLLDRLLILASQGGVEPVIVFTKADLAHPQMIEKINELYSAIDVKPFVVSSKQPDTLEPVRSLLDGKISVVAGPSGAGKSTLLNGLSPGLSLKTGDVSSKIGRGRHTTRHVELLVLPTGALIADTPGFSTLFLPDIPAYELGSYFPEMTEFLGCCRFNTCLHKAEPDCAVREALEKGLIHEQRYAHYLIFLNELVERERTAPKGKKS
ncbi:ribosome small subunit-dependent GTPase A [Heliobacillus mobilis]|uniref:Small ribosomal subunit biogenesis GTPase RsgA n=1 Tax=Heliobacterium mobile TaxID=28064 RepID=A0A6I3SF83_HELMO|nr:ribosome small subunit-dependent GTPase A [Heliobacterium mobile]MTV47640.1 ribosome small subunit-dependent GTPase A [Heliobacterium mobile]